MTETLKEFSLVQSISSHLHPTHGLHLSVHEQKLILCDSDMEVGRLALIRMERILVLYSVELYLQKFEYVS